MRLDTRQERGLLIIGLLMTILVTGWAVAQQPTTSPPNQPTLSQPEVPVATVPGTTATPGAGQPSTTAVPVTQVPSPAEPDHYKEQLMWALVASYLLKFLMRTKWFPWLKDSSTAHVKALAGFVMALATAAGIHLVVTGSLLDDSGATVTVTGISFDALKDMAWQWASQQGWYDLITKAEKSSA